MRTEPGLVMPQRRQQVFAGHFLLVQCRGERVRAAVASEGVAVSEPGAQFLILHVGVLAGPEVAHVPELGKFPEACCPLRVARL